MPAPSIPNEQTRQARSRLFLLYHELRNSESHYSYVTGAQLFSKQLDVYVESRNSGSSALWPEVTFDDGHISNHDLAAPVLAAHGLTAHFFITVGWTGIKPRYMGWPELRSLQEAGHGIGAHGWTHTLLTHCSDRELQMELTQSRQTLEDKLGTSITTMSLPGGRSNPRVLAACKGAGYTRVYNSIPRAESLPLGPTVGRLNVRGDMRPEWIVELLQPESGILSSLERRQRMKDAAKSLLGDRIYQRLWALVNRKEPEDDAA